MHPPQSVPQPFLEEESSAVGINLGQQLSIINENEEVSSSAINLPSIGGNRLNVFMETTPDTKGVQKKRFQEIIDSDDETNGNGSKANKVNSKKFRNQRDAFGDDSDHGINFPIPENDDEDGEDAIQLKTPEAPAS